MMSNSNFLFKKSEFIFIKNQQCLGFKVKNSS